MKKTTNTILEDHGDWLLIDISTPKHPKATMAVDADVWRNYNGGRVCAGVSSRGGRMKAQCRVNHRGSNFKSIVLPPKEGFFINHITHGNRTFEDNRRSNLRQCTASQCDQGKGMMKNNTSGVKGVCWNKWAGKWQASITIRRKLIHLGYFDDIHDAETARLKAERDLFGEYAFKETNEKGSK